MSQIVDLKELERKAFRSTFQDGLWDMFIGLAAVLFAVTPLLGDSGLGDFWSSVVMGCGWLLGMLGLLLVKKLVTAPRLGRVRPGPERRARLHRIVAVSTVVLLIGLIAGFAVYLRPQTDVRLLDWLVPATMGMVAFSMLGLGAYMLDLPRLYGYGVLVGVAPLVGEVLHQYAGAAHHGWPITFGCAGGIIFLIGMWIFIRFLRAYPLPKEVR